ncbi:hypothetical protein D3C80_677280 [compost metagenome]
MGQHALDQLADLAAQRHQAFDPGGMANGPGQVHQVDPLQGEQIAFGNHATQALVLDQADMGDVTFSHGNGGIERTGLGAQVERLNRHMAGNRLGKIGAGISHHLAQVAQGENADWKALRVDDDDAADLLLVHQRHGFAQRCLRFADNRVAHGQFAQAGIE